MIRVLRGGSWSDVPMYQRVSYRSLNGPVGRCGDFGFRLVRSAF